ncbi:MAG: aspartate/glutamate racemase family protein [Gammaproteobacteria bacterium]|nr:MAG: aspartate/glutamate racemase family protein [Gammaproteobacteria bacterium]
MKTIGLIGGLSWESTQVYYKYINTLTNSKLGGLNSAKINICSLNFSEIEKLMFRNDWDSVANIIIESALTLEKSGVDFILICTNTVHKVFDLVQNSINTPLIHIADAVGEQLNTLNIKKAGLLGTNFTMEQDFLVNRFQSKFDVDVLVPREDERKIIHSIIFDELCFGKILDNSRREFIRIINSLRHHGAEGVILGCTEIPLLVKDSDTNVRLFDSALIHSAYAVKLALE